MHVFDTGLLTPTIHPSTSGMDLGNFFTHSNAGDTAAPRLSFSKASIQTQRPFQRALSGQTAFKVWPSLVLACRIVGDGFFHLIFDLGPNIFLEPPRHEQEKIFFTFCALGDFEPPGI